MLLYTNKVTQLVYRGPRRFWYQIAGAENWVISHRPNGGQLDESCALVQAYTATIDETSH